MRTTIKPVSRLLLVLLLLATCFAVRSKAAGQPEKASVLSRGVHLLLDDELIARSVGVERKVIPPRRMLEGPVVTSGVEHQNWQPFLTVLRDPSAPAGKRFRMWYNADVVDDPADGAFCGVTAFLESADGIHWPGPYRRLTSLPDDGRVRFGAN